MGYLSCREGLPGPGRRISQETQGAIAVGPPWPSAAHLGPQRELCRVWGRLARALQLWSNCGWPQEIQRPLVSLAFFLVNRACIICSISILSLGSVRHGPKVCFPSLLCVYKPEARAAPHPASAGPTRSIPFLLAPGPGWNLGHTFFKAQCSSPAKTLLT